MPTNVRGRDYWWGVISPGEQSLVDYPAHERNFHKNPKGIVKQISFICGAFVDDDDGDDDDDGGGDDDDDDDDETFGWTFVAVDATWNSARKMVSRIPVSVPRVGVPADAFEALAARVPPLPTHDSLLGPVRKYDARKGAASEALKGKEQERRALGSSGAEGSGRRSTFEAVLASLLAVGALDEDACAALLRNVKVKVNAVLRQKHMPEAYDLRGEGGDAEEVASAFANAQV